MIDGAIDLTFPAHTDEEWKQLLGEKEIGSGKILLIKNAANEVVDLKISGGGKMYGEIPSLVAGPIENMYSEIKVYIDTLIKSALESSY